MTQSHLNRAVARATGESVGTIRRRGFSLVGPPTNKTSQTLVRGPHVVDWDEVDASRVAIYPVGRKL